MKIDGRRKYIYNENYFDVINTENKAYFLGLLYADGCNHGNCVTLTLQIGDREILELFKNDIDYTGNIKVIDQAKYSKRNNQFQCRIQLNGRHICDSLREIGCTERKSFTTQLPQIPRDLYASFVRGLFDGDGCISKRKFLITGSDSLIKEVNTLLHKECNLNSLIKPSKDRISVGISTLYYSSLSDVIKIRSWLYSNADTFLKRKKERFDILEEVVKSKTGYKNLTKQKITGNYEVRFGKYYIGTRHTIEEALQLRDTHILNGRLIKERGW